MNRIRKNCSKNGRKCKRHGLPGDKLARKAREHKLGHGRF